MKIDLETRTLQILERAPDFSFETTEISREFYLDSAEKLVRVAAKWQDENGAIIDPVTGEEWGQSSPRFLSPAAVLLHFGRLEDLRENVLRGMDWCCARLSSGQAKSPDFWMREVMTAWTGLQNQPIDSARRAKWKTQIRSIDPEAIYWQVSRDGSKIQDLHNWTVYAAAGEGLRELAGLGPEDETIVWGAKFFEKYMPAQLAHFSDEGMYRDPGDPFTYDMTTRLQFATPLALGLETGLRPALDDLLRRGALAQLLYVSPSGLAPFGGRSNGFHLQEAILSALGELEARRYKKTNPTLAGAFKRQAHLSAQSVARWLEMTPHRHLKNGFAPQTRHGCENYALYSVYSLFTASCFALAALFADEEIEEAPTPAEIGGFVFQIAPAFHKIFANCGQTQIEIDTRADPHYDATGLGRFLHANAPAELGLLAPFSATPSFQIADELRPPHPVAIGPVWTAENGQRISLASLSDGLESQLHIETESPEMVAFGLEWQHGASQTHIRENYELTPGKLRYRVAVLVAGTPQKVRLMVPLLESDGQETARLDLGEKGAQIFFQKSTFRVRFAGKAQLGSQPIANRNGIYRVLEIEGSEVELELSASKN